MTTLSEDWKRFKVWWSNWRNKTKYPKDSQWTKEQIVEFKKYDGQPLKFNAIIRKEGEGLDYDPGSGKLDERFLGKLDENS